jgi:hypothetical protein
MSLRFLGPADGRLHRGLRAIGKLVALGFDERDVVNLMKWRKKGSLQGRRTLTSGAPCDAGGKQARRQLAQWAIRTLMTLGFNEKEIAGLAGVDPTTVAHALDPYDDRAVGEATAQKLKQVVHSAGEERLKLLLPGLAVNVIETCCNKGRRVDDMDRSDAAVAVRAVLRNILLGTPSSSSLLPEGIDAFLAQIGDPSNPMWVFWDRPEAANTPQQRLARARRREHEANHLLQRFREDRDRLERLFGSKVQPPPRAGGIA